MNDADRKAIQVSCMYDYLSNDTYLQIKYNQQVFKYLSLELFADGFVNINSDEIEPFRRSQKVAFSIGYKW